MGYLDPSVLTIDAILTRKGREALAKNDGSFRITQFALADDEIDYTLYNPNKYFHIVTVYTGSTMKIYVDGKLVAVKNTGKINFTNESLTLTCGPSDVNKSFIIDAPAVYRYSLNDNQVLNHYIDAQTNSEAQIVISDYGKIFKTTEKHQSETEKFIYPITKSCY